jgi:hypothetical protein
VSADAPVSFCARHAPPDFAIVDPGAPGGWRLAVSSADGRLHLTAERLAALRTACARHIGECRLGPILAMPVAVDD